MPTTSECSLRLVSLQRSGPRLSLTATTVVVCIALGVSPAAGQQSDTRPQGKGSAKPAAQKAQPGNAGQFNSRVPALTLNANGGAISKIAFSPVEQRLVCADTSQSIKVWNLVTEKLSLTLNHNHIVGCVAISPDGKQIASGSNDSTIKLWNAATGHEVLTITGFTDGVSDVAYSPNGKQLAAVSSGKLSVWDISTHTFKFKESSQRNNITRLLYSPDGKWLAAGDTGNVIVLWDTTSGKQSIYIDLSVSILSLFRVDESPRMCSDMAFSPDEQWLATASWHYDRKSGEIKLWKLATSELSCTLRGHHGHVESVAFSPDGNWLASGSSDRTIKLWDVPGGQSFLTFSAHTDRIGCLAFSPDGKQLASGSNDRTVKVWDISIIGPQER